MLQEPLEGTGTIDRVITAVHDEVLGGIGEPQTQLTIRQTLLQISNQQINDLLGLFLLQGLVEYDLIQPVEELGTELLPQQLFHFSPGGFGDVAILVDAVQDIGRAQVGGEDNDGILEVHCPALGVGDPTVIQYLEQDIEYIRVCLFDLIKEHNRIGLAADCFGELTALLITYISGRRSDQTADREFLHILGHINAHQIAFIVKQGFCQCLGKFCLAHAGGTQEQEGPNGTIRVLDTGTAAENGLGHLGNGLVLTHYPLVQDLVHVQQFLPFAFHELGYRDTGPAGHDPGDLLIGDTVMQEVRFPFGLFSEFLLLFQFLLELGQTAILEFCRLVEVVFHLGCFDFGIDLFDLFPERTHLGNGVLFIFPLGLHAAELFPELCQFPAQVGKVFHGELVSFLLQGGFFDLQLHDPAVEFVHLGRHGIQLGTDHGTGFIHQVDGLIGQEPVGDIPMGQHCRGNERLILDLDAMEYFIAFLQTTQNGDGILHSGLIHHDRLEPTFQSGILFDVLTVLVEGGGADAVQFTTGQHGLEEVACVHGALGLAGAHNGVQLIDEENDLAFTLLDFLEHCLESFLKFAPELGASHQRTHIQ